MVYRQFSINFGNKPKKQESGNYVGLEATEPVSELVTQMEIELINIHVISVQQKR